MMENTQDLDIDVEDIGTILKSSRLKQKKSMEEISSELCIRKIYLTALEEGDYETLPPVPYGVGYVRTYARYLGLNPERAVKLYKAAFEQDDEQEEEKLTPEVNKSSRRHIIAGILALAMVYGGWYVITTTSKPVDNMSKDEVLQEEIISQEVLEKPEEIESLQNADMSQAQESSAIVEQIEQKTDDVVPQTPITEVVEEVAPVIPEDKVIVEFVGESWVELKDKKRVYFQGVFHEGDKKEIDYTDNMFISVGRPQNVKVYVKGAEKDILIKRRKMNIPLDSLN